jgi:hypothetical protein
MTDHPLPPFNQPPERPSTSHRCPAPGCPLVVPNRLFCCVKDWRRLPDDIRRAIWASYRPGQTVATASEAWKQAARQAMEVWKLGAGKAAGARMGE